MKRTALAAIVLVAGMAQAQEKTGSRAAAWFITSSNARGTATMDTGRLKKRRGVALAQAALYYVSPEETTEGTVDFLLTMGAYDCSRPGYMKNLMGEGYRIGQQPPVFSYDIPDAPWKSYPVGSPGMGAWTTACEGPRPELEVKNMQTHEQVLDVVRRQGQELSDRLH